MSAAIILAASVTGRTNLTTLVTFDGSNGQFPENAPLVQGVDGNLYGTTNSGGIINSSCGAFNGCGTVFKITPNGTLATLYEFCSQPNCTDGLSPFAGLALAADGSLYGTTTGGGANNGGTAFRITPTGRLTTIYDFCSGSNCPDGGGPFAGFVQATDGNLYGTNHGGIYGGGTVFKLTPTGKLTTLYSFCAQLNCPDGEAPTAPLIEGADRNLYGTTVGGGIDGNGTVFKITPQGTLTTLYRFFCTQADCNDGSQPSGGLIQGTDSNFYGMTESGGIHNNNQGTVFKISSEGTLTTLYSFCSKPNCRDGQLPQYTKLIQATDGNFYGTTFEGGAYGSGTVFKITPSGTLTTVYSFCAQGAGWFRPRTASSTEQQSEISLARRVAVAAVARSSASLLVLSAS